MKIKSKAITTAAMCALFVAAAGIGTTTALMTGSSTVTNRINIADEGIDAVILETDWDGIIGYNTVGSNVFPVYDYRDNPDDRTSELKPVYGFLDGDYSKPIFSSNFAYLGQRPSFNSQDETQTFDYGDDNAKLMIPGSSAAKNPCIQNTTKFAGEKEWAAMKITFVYA